MLDAVKKAKVLTGSNEDIGFLFWKPERSSLTGNRHYCRIDPKKAMLVRFMGFDEADIRPSRGTALRTSLPNDWAEDYILGTLYSPVGSVIEQRKIGNMKVLHINEQNGLELYHLIGRKMTFAVYRPENAQPYAEEVPRPVQRMLKEKGSVVRVWEDEAGELHSEAVPPENFITAIGLQTACAQLLASVPDSVHDMSLLKKFNDRAEAKPEAKTFIGRMLSRAFNKAAPALRAIKLLGPEPDGSQRLTARTLRAQLEDREVIVSRPKGPEHPASSIAPEADPSPIARHG